MIIARLHRGGLDESMETAKTFNNIDEMKRWFVEMHDNAFLPSDVIVKDEVTYDGRVGWNTRYVCTKRYMEENFIKKYGSPQCIGMCDLDYKSVDR